MAVDATSATAPTSQPLTSQDLEARGSAPGDGTSVRRIDPNSEDVNLEGATESFLTSMMANQFMLNNSLFNFAKEAIDEAEQ